VFCEIHVTFDKLACCSFSGKKLRESHKNHNFAVNFFKPQNYEKNKIYLFVVADGLLAIR